jgi:hypothetical protein
LAGGGYLPGLREPLRFALPSVASQNPYWRINADVARMIVRAKPPSRTSQSAAGRSTGPRLRRHSVIHHYANQISQYPKRFAAWSNVAFLILSVIRPPPTDAQRKGQLKWPAGQELNDIAQLGVFASE